MNNNIIKIVSHPKSNQDVATKNYVDTNAFTTAGVVVSGDIKLSVVSDLERSIGCDDLRKGKKFALLLGSNLNILSFTIPDPFALLPVKLKTIAGFVIMIDHNPICDFSRNLILCGQPIDMNQHSIKNLKSPVNKFDAVNKSYVDRVKYKTATGTIPNAVLTDHTLFKFSALKSV